LDVVRESHGVANGDYGSRVEVYGNDELAELTVHFNRMADVLERNEADRVEMIRAVAHELRTPLSALQGFAEGLLDGVVPLTEAARAIARETISMKRVASDLWLVARVESGRVEVDLEPLAVAQVVEDVRERYAQAFEGKQVRLESEVLKAAHGFVLAVSGWAGPVETSLTTLSGTPLVAAAFDRRGGNREGSPVCGRRQWSRHS
jgi:signal transduction histidine kinase